MVLGRHYFFPRFQPRHLPKITVRWAFSLIKSENLVKTSLLVLSQKANDDNILSE